jgi:hypothetical protein
MADNEENGNGKHRLSISEELLDTKLEAQAERFESRQKIAHLKTRSMVLLMTAPIWGTEIANVANHTAGVLSGVGAFTLGAIGMIAFRRGG